MQHSNQSKPNLRLVSLSGAYRSHPSSLMRCRRSSSRFLRISSSRSRLRRISSGSGASSSLRLHERWNCNAGLHVTPDYENVSTCVARRAPPYEVRVEVEAAHPHCRPHCHRRRCHWEGACPRWGFGHLSLQVRAHRRPPPRCRWGGACPRWGFDHLQCVEVVSRGRAVRLNINTQPSMPIK